MAFNLSNWSRMSASGNTTISVLQDGSLTGSPSMFSYISADDDLATILAGNYFGQQANEVNQTDFIYCVAADGIFNLVIVSVNEQTKTVQVAQEAGGGGGSGNVTGPDSSTNHAIARYAGTSGTNIANSVVTIDDGGNIAGIDNITMNGVLDITGSIIMSTGSTIYFYDSSNTHYIGLDGGSPIQNFIYALPAAPPSESGMQLIGNTDGTTFWATTAGAQWIEVTSNTSMAVNNGYITNSSSTLNMTLPPGASKGDTVEVRGFGTGGFKVTQNSNDVIFLGNISTTVGTSGYIHSSRSGDAVYLVCIDTSVQNVWSCIFTGQIANDTGAINTPGNLAIPIPVTYGGTNAASFTAYGTVYAGVGGSSLTSSSTGTSGQVWTSNGSGAAPTWQNGGGGGGIAYNVITSGPQTMAANNSYVTNSTSLIQGNLPSTAAVGTVWGMENMNTGGWKLQCNTGQVINFNSTPTSSGGSLASTSQYDGVLVLCIVANTTFKVINSVGSSITVS